MMKTKEQDVEAVNALTHNQSCGVRVSEDGGGEVYRIWDTLILFSIPQYGGKASYQGTFRLDEVEKLVDLAHTWT